MLNDYVVIERLVLLAQTNEHRCKAPDTKQMLFPILHVPFFALGISFLKPRT